MTTVTTTDLLTDDMLARFDQRAPVYDRENRFFDEDFEELKASGYTRCTLPVEAGRLGPGARRVRPARAPARLRRPGDRAGHEHALLLDRAWPPTCARWATTRCSSSSTARPRARSSAPCTASPATTCRCCCRSSTAERVDGGWQISGHKIFGSLSPVWDYGGLHAMDTSDPEHPQIVHAFLPREARGYQIMDTWDTLGMRATQSQDTILEKAFVPDELVALVCPAGFAGAGLFQVGIFAWALMGFAATYLGAAKRAFDLTVENLPKRTSIAIERRRWRTTPRSSTPWPTCASPTTRPRRCSSGPAPTGPPASSTPTGRCGWWRPGRS